MGFTDKQKLSFADSTTVPFIHDGTAVVKDSWEIAEHLVVSPVLLQEIDHVLERRPAASSRPLVPPVRLFHPVRQLCQRLSVESREREDR